MKKLYIKIRNINYQQHRSIFLVLERNNYRLGNLLMKKGNISAKDINRVLTFCKVKITDQMLVNMLAIDRLVFNDLSKNTIKSPEYIQNIGTYRGKIQIPGVYI